MAQRKTPSRKPLSDAALVERLQSILINAAQGQRSIADDRQYSALRNDLRKRPFAQPELVKIHPSVDSFVASIKGSDDRRDAIKRVRQEFGELLQALETTGQAWVDSSMWTGQADRVARLRTVKTLLPLARSAVESMITTLSEPNPNGGPLLDEREEALDHLRSLHRTLGEYLTAIEAGHLDDDLGQGLAAETARYAKKAARALRDDPMPYLSSALLLGIFSACGMPGIGGYLSGVAMNLRKHDPKARPS